MIAADDPLHPRVPVEPWCSDDPSVRLEWSQVRVGVFLIVALSLLAYAVYRVGDLFDVFADATRSSRRDRADGLVAHP